MHFYSENNIQKLENYLKVKKQPGVNEIQLWEKVSRFNTYFTKIPGILGIAVCNSLAMNAAHKDSDIDLFIITQKNRIWTVRILITLLLFILGERKTSKNHAGKFCLSFFITEKGLNFESIAIENDLYLAYWIDTLQPIVNRKNIFNIFKNENSRLLGRNTQTLNKIPEQGLLKTPQLLIKCGDYCEKLFKSIFLRKTKNSFQKLGKPFGVVISDEILKFHDTDRRKEIRDIIISS